MQLDAIATALQQQNYLVLDGALATELERRGANLDDPLWSAKLLIESPEMIRAVHYDYLEAGADIICTASYQATLEGFVARGMTAEEATRLLELSVQLAVTARDEFWSLISNRRGRIRPLVAASIGPYGAYLADGSEYRGDYGLSKRELMSFHRQRFQILARTDVDFLAFETIPSLQEGRAIVELLKEAPEARAWLSFSCCDATHTCHGEDVAECAALANASSQVVAIGVNCTPPRYIRSLTERIRSATHKPIVVYPNSGEGWDAASNQWVEVSDASSISTGARQWNEAGAQILGGCCRTTPEDIRSLRAELARCP